MENTPASPSAATPLHIDIGCFEGPLELLLHLIRAQEVDIWEVSLSEICDQYIATLERSKELDIEIGGEFLIIAATLLVIKSKRILPGAEQDDEELATDPREELIRQILTYSECKKWAEWLSVLQLESCRYAPRGWNENARVVEEDESTYNAYTIFSAYQRILESTYFKASRIITLNNKTASQYRDGVLERLGRTRSLDFLSLFDGATERIEVVATFLAVLELVKEGFVDVHQGTTFGSIRISLIEKGQYERTV